MISGKESDNLSASTPSRKHPIAPASGHNPDEEPQQAEELKAGELYPAVIEPVDPETALYPVKTHYSNLDINMGMCPGWKSEYIITSNGNKHYLYEPFINKSFTGPMRKDFPYHRPPNAQSIVTLLKGMIGKDLTRFDFPLSFMEP